MTYVSLVQPWKDMMCMVLGAFLCAQAALKRLLELVCIGMLKYGMSRCFGLVDSVHCVEIGALGIASLPTFACGLIWVDVSR